MNISGLDGDSLENGALGCTIFSEETSTMVTLVDWDDGNCVWGGG
jgi:hypothetical protein